MPRAVYRVSIELIHTDAAETLAAGAVPLSHEGFGHWEQHHEQEIESLAQLKARIMGTPGLVKYPKDVTATDSWGKALRREPTVIELDIDRATEDALGADRASLMKVVDFLTVRVPVGTPYWDKAEPSYWPALVAWRWDGTEESTATIKRDVERLVPGSNVRLDGEDEDNRPALVIDVPPVEEDESSEVKEALTGWIAFEGHYVAVIDGLVRTWDDGLFERHYTPTRPPVEIADTSPSTVDDIKHDSASEYRFRSEDHEIVRAWRWDGSVTYEQIQDDLRKISTEMSVRQYRERVVDAPVDLLIDVPAGSGSLVALHCPVGDYIVRLPSDRIEVYPASLFAQTFESTTEQLRTPQDWCNLKAMTIVDPDGWMDPTLGSKGWDEPISEVEFDNRAALSTVA